MNKKIIGILVITVLLFGFTIPNNKTLFSIEMYYFDVSVHNNLDSNKTIKIIFTPGCDLFVPIVDNNRFFQVTQEKNNWKNTKNKKIIVHLDWNYDLIIKRNELRLKHLKNNQKIVEIIDLSAYNNIDAITFSISFFEQNKSSEALFSSAYHSFPLFHRYLITIDLTNPEYYPLSIESF